MMTKDSHHGNSNCRSARQSRPKRSRRSGTSCCRCQGKTIVARHTLFREYLGKTTFYGGKGSDFVPWPF